jgi:UDP-N-acetylmuramoyl-tripeptide--D-alanyl-D-alanine ligase
MTLQLSREFLTTALQRRGAQIGDSVPTEVSGVGTDTRALEAGCLFVALVGENFDGHDYCRDALVEGAAAALVQRDRVPAPHIEDPRFILVDDTLLALQDLAQAHLDRLQLKKVCLTGSSGKTTAKELIASALRAVFGENGVLATQGNFNNHIGLPLTLLRGRAHHQVAVLEMGMNHFGEIARLAEIAPPDVGLITNIGSAHAGNLGGIEGVAKAKGELFAALPRGAAAVINAEDARVVAQAEVHGVEKRVTFGRGAGVDVRITNVQTHLPSRQGPQHGSLSVTFELHGDTFKTEIPLEGEHNAENAAAALAVAHALKLNPGRAVSGMARVRGVAGRMKSMLAPSGAVLIDDTYNANPDSMRAGLRSLLAYEDKRRVAVLGEMLELGDVAHAAHRALGKSLVEAGIAQLFVCGPLGKAIGDGAREAGLSDENVAWAEHSKALVAPVRAALRGDEVVLIKGSRGSRMEHVVQGLMEAGGED